MLAIVRHLISIIALPGAVAVVVPYFILSKGELPVLRLLSIWIIPIMAGVFFLLVGLALAGWTIWLFATVGRGTLAPWDPPQHLVCAGPYRHVRNPMISGVICILIGQTLLFQSPGLLAWTAAFFGINALYIPLLEEPLLERRFGNQYSEYKRNAPRWIPRLKSWPAKAQTKKTRRDRLSKQG